MLSTQSFASKIPQLYILLQAMALGTLHCSALPTVCLNGSSCENEESKVHIGGQEYCCPPNSVLAYSFHHDDVNVGLVCKCTPARVRREDLSEECIAENEGKYFGCSNSSQVIALSQVNDNYCDCENGSDEPTTSACAGSALGLFKCGYAEEDLVSSSKVGDSVCDCCDGLDEPQHVCANTCNQKFHLKKLAKQNYIDEIALGLGKMQAERSARRETKENERTWKQISRMNSTLVRLKTTFDTNCRAEGLPNKEFFRTEELEKTIKEVDDHLKVSSLSSDELVAIALKLTCGVEEAKEVYGKHEEIMQTTALQVIELSFYCGNLEKLYELVESGETTQADQDETRDKLGIWQKRVWSMSPRTCEIQSRLEAKRREIEEQRAFVGLPEKCEKVIFGGYNYTVCPRVQVYQDSLLLGKFARLFLLVRKRTKEDYLSRPATVRVRFAGGSICNKSPRSVELYLYCNATTSIVRVDEPQTCQYEIHMNSPGGCYDDLIHTFNIDEATLQSVRSGVEWNLWYERNFTVLLLLLAVCIIAVFVLLLCCALSKYAQGDVALDVKTTTEENIDGPDVASEASTS